VVAYSMDPGAYVTPIRINGGDGNDRMVSTATAAVTFVGEAGSNTLVGNSGYDMIHAGVFNGGGVAASDPNAVTNRVAGRTGNDSVYLDNKTSDQVMFRLGDGTDTINFFEAGASGKDTVLIDTRLASDFAHLMSKGVQETGFLTFKFADGSSVKFAGLTAASFSEDDFVFANLSDAAVKSSLAPTWGDWVLA